MVERLTLLILSNLGCFEQLFVVSCSRLALIWSTISTMRASGCWENNTGLPPSCGSLTILQKGIYPYKSMQYLFPPLPFVLIVIKKTETNMCSLLWMSCLWRPQRICSNWAVFFVLLPSLFSWTNTWYIIVSHESAVLGLSHPHTLPPLPPPLTHHTDWLHPFWINHQCTSAPWSGLYSTLIVSTLTSTHCGVCGWWLV